MPRLPNLGLAGLLTVMILSVSYPSTEATEPLCPSWQNVALCEQVWQYRGAFAYYAEFHGRSFGVDVPADLMAAIACFESGGDPRLVSSAGAIGVMQVMPFHFREGEDPLNPYTNIRQGVRVYAAILAEIGHDHDAALRAYVAGWDGMDSEVARLYAQNVLQLYEAVRCR